MSFEKLYYKGKEVKRVDSKMNTVTLVLRKNSNVLDMRYKSNKEYYKKFIWKPRWYRFLQYLADVTGARNQVLNGLSTRWSLWFNPWYQLHRLAWKLGIMWPYKL